MGEVADRGGVGRFVVHARSALLDGLSPEQNRTIPPLRHERVRALARDFPSLALSANGGLGGAHAVAAEMARGGGALPPLEGGMVGRGAWRAPWEALGDADRAVHGLPNRCESRRALLHAYGEYCEAAQARFDVKADGHEVPSARVLLRPVLNLFKGEAGTGRYKRLLDEELRAAPRVRARDAMLRAAEACIADEVLDAPPCESATARAARGEAARPAVLSIAPGEWEAQAPPPPCARGARANEAAALSA